jgi:uncharacterized membrane protein YjfL (UPF0719 family)
MILSDFLERYDSMNIQTTLFAITTTLVLVAAARFINQFVMNVRLTESLVQRDNPAIGVQIAGYLLAILLIIAAVLTGDGHGNLANDVLSTLLYGVIGIVLLAVVASFALKIFLNTECLESVRNGNIAAAIVAAASYIATGLIIAACVSGEYKGGTALTAVVFFCAGQASLVLITFLFRRLTAYDDVKEILEGNLAAALSYAGIVIAVGIIVGHAAEGDFVDYATSFAGFGKALAVVVALYPIRQFLVQGMLLGSGFSLYAGALDREICEDRNINAGIIEAVSYIAAALMIVRLM